MRLLRTAGSLPVLVQPLWLDLIGGNHLRGYSPREVPPPFDSRLDVGRRKWQNAQDEIRRP